LGALEGFRIQSEGADDELKSLPQKQKAEKLEDYRKEMNDFTKFLKDKYFSE